MGLTRYTSLLKKYWELLIYIWGAVMQVIFFPRLVELSFITTPNFGGICQPVCLQ